MKNNCSRVIKEIYVSRSILVITSKQNLNSLVSRFVSCGPRLSSFLLDTSEQEEALDISDANKYVPLGRDQTLQLCGYPIHDLPTSVLQQLPPHIVFKEYGVKVNSELKKKNI